VVHPEVAADPGQRRDEYGASLLWPCSASARLTSRRGQSPETLEIVTNDAVIGINQDPAGAVANRLLNVPVTDGTLSLWQGWLENG
jgi:hypothetical protein